MPLQRPPIAREFQVEHRERHAHKGDWRKGKAQRGRRNFRAVGGAIDPDARLGAQDAQAITRADLFDEAQRVVVVGEPVVVEFLERPIPLGFAEAGSEAADLRRGFVTFDMVAGAGDIPGGGEGRRRQRQGCQCGGGAGSPWRQCNAECRQVVAR